MLCCVILSHRGVQKTKELKKPPKTNRTIAKISVRFQFHFLKTEIFSFGSVLDFFTKPTEPTDVYIYLRNFKTKLISGLVVYSLWFG